MTFSPPTLPWRQFREHPFKAVPAQAVTGWFSPRQKNSLELTVLLALALLLFLGTMALIHSSPAPDLPAAATPILAEPQPIGPVHFSKLQGDTSITESIDRFRLGCPE